MNIALINQWYPPENGFGGIATYNYYFAHAYSKLGHNVFVIASLAGKAEPYRCDNGVHLFRIKQLNFSWRFNRIPSLGGFIRFLRDLHYSFCVKKKLLEIDKKFKIDIVEYAEINAEGFIHSLFGPKRIPFIVRCHTPSIILKDYYLKSEHRPVSNAFIYIMERLFIRKAPHITTPSRHLANAINQKLNISIDRILVIPNAIDAARFHPEDNVHRYEETVNILFVGRIERAKGAFVLAKAFVELAEIYRDRLKCVVVGSDRPSGGKISTIKTLRDIFSAHGVLENVEFKGELSDDELISIYNECDIFVNPSLIYESFSYTCLEAMACSKPVVASRIGGIEEVVEDGGTGLLFEPGNIEALTAKIKLLTDDAKKRKDMGDKGRKRAEEYFNVIDIAKANIEIYWEARGKRSQISG